MKKNDIMSIIIDNVKTLIYASNNCNTFKISIFSTLLYTFIFYGATLLVGDRLFVSKYTYGYSKHSFPSARQFIIIKELLKKNQKEETLLFLKLQLITEPIT